MSLLSRNTQIEAHESRHASTSTPRSRTGKQLLTIRVLRYFTNHVVAHIPSYTIRHAWYARILGIRMGQGAAVHPNCYVWFYGPGSIRRKGVHIGANSRINRGCTIDLRGGLTIGDNVSVSAEATILTSVGMANSQRAGEASAVVIEDNVWIGTRAIVMPGVTIGRGAVVGAGAVVMRDVQPLAIVFGSPARPVTSRSDQEAQCDRQPAATVRMTANGITAAPAEQIEATGAGEGRAGLALVFDASAAEGPQHAQPATAPSAEPAKGTTRVAKNLGALAGGQLVTWSMTLVWTLVVPRALGPAGLGIVVSAQSVAGVLGIVLGFGTRSYLVREIVIEPRESSKLVGTAVILRLTLAPVVALAAVLWAKIAHDGHDATIVLYLVTTMTILTLLAEPAQAAFQALERMKYLAYADVINKSCQSLIGIVLVILGFRAVAIAGNMAAVAGVVLLLNLIWIRRFVRIDVRTTLRRTGVMAKQSLAYWAFGLFGFFYLWIDTIMLSLMTDPTVVGWYGATTQIFQTLMFLPVLVSTAWLPRLVAAFTHGRDHVLKAARAPIDFILVISVPVAAGIAMIAPAAIHAVYGPKFGHAVPVMVVLAFCIPPIYLNIVLAQVLLAEKRQAVWTAVMAAAAVVNPLMNLFLIPLTQGRYHNGAIGAAISLVLTELLMDIAGLVIVGHHVLDRRAFRRCASAVVASAGMWGVFYAASPAGTAPSLVAGMTALIGLALALRIATEDEMALIRTGIARLRGRLVPRFQSS